MDIGIIFSGNNPEGNAVKANFVKKFLEKYTITQDKTRVGIIRPTAKGLPSFLKKLSEQMTVDDIEKDLLSIAASGAMDTFVSRALKLAKNELYDKSNGGRDHAFKSLLVILDGDDKQLNKSVQYVDELKSLSEDAVKTVVVAIGGSVINKDLADAVKPKTNLVTVENPDKLFDKLDDILKKIRPGNIFL